MYPTRDDNGDIRAPPCAPQFKNLHHLVSHLLLKVDDHHTKPTSPNKRRNIPSLPADAVYEGGSVDEDATHAVAQSIKTTYIDPREEIDLLPRAFNYIVPPVNVSTPGLWTPIYKVANKFLTSERHCSSRDDYRHLARYGSGSAALDAALETAQATIRSTTATATERPHDLDVHEAAIRTHKAVMQAVESRLTYIR
jgi:hypothetical protein